VIAKTCHYWLGHIPADQQRAIGELFNVMAAESPLVEPELASPDSAKSRTLATGIAELIHRSTGLSESPQRYPGWLGLECPSIRFAVWMMRALVASNVLSRREGTVLFVPVNPATDPHGTIVASAVERTYRCATDRAIG
jgi:hypothetical protein